MGCCIAWEKKNDPACRSLSMANLTIIFGVLLSLLGGGMYVYTDRASLTALIPAFFGVPFIVLGMIAQKEAARKHAMHGVALLSLIGLLLSLGRVIYVM